MLTLLLRVNGMSGRTRDVSVELEDDHSVADLAQALAAHLGDSLPVGHVPHLSCDRIGLLTPASTVVNVGLLSGDEVSLSLTMSEGAAARPKSAGGLFLEVISGPSSGTSVPLRAGSYRVGRDPEFPIALADPTVSKHHATIHVDSSAGVAIEVAPNITNELLVNGVAIAESTSLNVESVVQLGSSAFTIRLYRPEVVTVRDQLGQIPFNRTPYRRPEVGEPKVDGPGRLPSRFEKRQFQVIAMIMPAMSGLIMWATMPSGGSRYLLVALLTPVMGLVTWWDERRRGGKKHQQEEADFKVKLQEWLERYDEALDKERTIRYHAAPDLASVVRRARVRSTDLWQRVVASQDFLTVRVGLGEDKAATVTEIPQGDDSSLLNEIEDQQRLRSVLQSVPVSLNLVKHSVVALHGASAEVDMVAAALAIQVAGLHSPEDAVIAAALSTDRSMRQWVKWLPHTRSVSSPLSGGHVACGREESEDLIRRLLEIGATRGENAPTRVVLLLDERCDLDSVLVSSLLDAVGSLKFSVIWLGDSLAMVPRQASAVIECPDPTSGNRGVLWFTDPTIETKRVDLDRMGESNALEFARSLAPVTDTTSASATASIPRVAPLFASFGVLEATPQWVADNWSRNTAYGLRAPIGTGATGTFTIDLVQNGPHGLIAGTSGAGKSELLQSLVASLAAQYPPERLNFLFIDYKGGASSNMFKDIPHTVGYVTNLSPSLSMRALTSLRAELNRRMRVLEGRAKDIEEMLEKYPNECPPSLVIVVDEFATLVKEIPDFVTGMVDVAQRGRSLGIHLILATQRPTGAVNDNILANTNLRISLRVLDGGDSQAIIGTADAAFLPAPLKGRAFARTGAGQIMEFQSAFAGAPFTAAAGVSAITADDFPSTGQISQWPPRERTVTADTTSTQLDVLVRSIAETTRVMGKSRGRAPWLEALPPRITLDEVHAGQFGVVTRECACRDVVVGVVDDPESQNQFPHIVNLEATGGLLLFGTGASGKTTAIRTVISEFVRDASYAQAHVYILDFAGRALETLRDHGHIAAVATGDDLEQVTRIIQHLQEEIVRRQALLSSSGSENFTVFLQKTGRDAEPRILLVMDGMETFSRVFDRSDLYPWTEALSELILAGRSVGIHFVGTADRRASVPAVIMNAIDEKVVLRMSDSDGLVDLGVPLAIARSADLGEGSALLLTGSSLQIPLVSVDASADSQTRRLVTDLDAPSGQSFRLRQLPEDLAFGQLGRDENANGFRIGIEDLSWRVATSDLRNSNFLIVGHPESGRSTAIATIAQQLQDSAQEIYVICDPESPLAHIGAAATATSKVEQINVIQRLESASSRQAISVLLVDCASGIDDSSGYQLESMMTENRVRVVATTTFGAVSGYASGWLGEMKRSRRKLVLQPDDDSAVMDVAGVRVRWRPGMKFPPGRGVFVDGRRAVLVQVARQ